MVLKFHLPIDTRGNRYYVFRSSKNPNEGFKIDVHDYWCILATTDAWKAKNMPILLGNNRFKPRQIPPGQIIPLEMEWEIAGRIILRHPIATYYMDTETEEVIPVLCPTSKLNNASAALYTQAGIMLCERCSEQDAGIDIQLGDKSPNNFGLSLDEITMGSTLFMFNACSLNEHH